MSTDIQLIDKIIELRREFHQHPELSRNERQTAERIKRELERLRIPYRSEIAGHGIVADMPGKQSGPYIALRADMDALPIQEETGLPFSSVNDGVMHACAHDAHMSILIGAAEELGRSAPYEFPIRLIFQPSEELGAGAKEMVEEDVLEDVALIFGGHFDRHYQTGEIVVTEGAVNASTDQFTIKITGQGAHGARPHESTDAVVVGSLIVMAIQTLVSREINPAHPSVVTVGEFKAGSAANVIAGEALLRGTIRTQDKDVRKHLTEGVSRIAKSICELHGARSRVSIESGTPLLVNTPEMVHLAREAAAEVIGEEHVTELRTANMGGEDFSYYLEHVPGCYVRYGAQAEGRESYPAHSSKFDIDEAALPIAAAYLTSVAKRAIDYLGKSLV